MVIKVREAHHRKHFRCVVSPFNVYYYVFKKNSYCNLFDFILNFSQTICVNMLLHIKLTLQQPAGALWQRMMVATAGGGRCVTRGQQLYCGLT